MKIKTLLVVFFLSMVGLLTAQTELKINPIGALFGLPDISAEFAVNESVGIEPFVGLTFRNTDVNEDEFKTRGFRLGAFGKYYFSPNKGCDKFWAGLYMRGGSSTSRFGSGSNEDKFSNNRFAVGLGLGYKWVSKRNVIFELGFGAGRAFVNKFTVESGTVDLDDIPLLNIDFIGRIAIGYRFGGGATKGK